MNKKTVQSLIFASGLALGGLGAGLYFKQYAPTSGLVLPHKDLTTFDENVFDRDFFRREQSPFEQMEKMRKEMDKVFESSMKEFSKISFDDWHGPKFGAPLDDIRQEEDNKFVYYKINLYDVDRKTLKSEVRGGQVTISGSRRDVQAQEEEGSTMRSESYHSFQRSFPVPAGVDPNKVEFETKDDELVIKFPKMPEEDRPMV